MGSLSSLPLTYRILKSHHLKVSKTLRGFIFMFLYTFLLGKLSPPPWSYTEAREK